MSDPNNLIDLDDYCGIRPIKCRQVSKTNKSNCQFCKKLIFDCLGDNSSQDLFGQRPQYLLKHLLIITTDNMPKFVGV